MIQDEIVTVQCGSCGTFFGMQKSLNEKRQNDHATFHCPNGHPRIYPAPKVDPIDKVKADLATMTVRAEALAAWVSKAPHLTTCDVHVDRPCDCGRAALVTDEKAHETAAK